MTRRCDWANGTPMMAAYHDTEWGVPLYDDRKLFEFLILDAMQAGLSWEIVLNKREHFRKAFDGFDAKTIARDRAAKVNAPLKDPGIIRKSLKINSTITNAKAFLQVQEECGGFARYLWGFVGSRPIQHAFHRLKELPSESPASNQISKDLVRRGFRFVGPTICYAFMQAAGLVNDHLVHCFRYAELARWRPER